jgi:hypothetical protein
MTRRSSVLLFLVLFSCVATTARAQYLRTDIFFAPGAQVREGDHLATYGAGVGIEQVLADHFGAQFEGGVALSKETGPYLLNGTAAFNGVYHVMANAAADPFVDAGYSLLFRSSATNMAGFGGGLRYWTSERAAFVVEIRFDWAQWQSPKERFVTVRVGWGWR